MDFPSRIQTNISQAQTELIQVEKLMRKDEPLWVPSGDDQCGMIHEKIAVCKMSKIKYYVLNCNAMENCICSLQKENG